MRKVLSVLAFSLTLLFASFSLVFADTYEIPVIANGKVITLTLTVEESQITSVTTSAKGVLLGKAKKIETDSGGIVSGYWSQQIPNALDLVKVEKDKFSGNTFYISKIEVTGKTMVYPYVGTDGKSLWFRFSANLIMDEPLIFNSCTIVADGKKYNLKFPVASVNSEYLGYEKFFASGDIGLNGAEERDMLDAVAMANDIEMRFYGLTGTYDHTLTKSEKNTFAEALAVYELLGGKLD